VLSIPSEELTWWNLFNVREMTWINTLRTHNRYPTIRWIYRPRTFFRDVSLNEGVFNSIDPYINPFRQCNMAYLNVAPPPEGFRREWQINHVTHAFHSLHYHLQQHGHALPRYSKYTNNEMHYWEELSLILRP